MILTNNVRCQGTCCHQSCTRHLTVLVVFNRASIAAAATVSARGLFSNFIFLGLVVHLLGNDFDPRPQHSNPFALMVAGIESLVAAFVLHAIKCKEACSLLHAVINLLPFPFQQHVEVLASENIENVLRETMRIGERETVRKSHTIRPLVPRLWGTDPRWYELANYPQFYSGH
jgi:hypothetical protein